MEGSGTSPHFISMSGEQSSDLSIKETEELSPSDVTVAVKVREGDESQDKEREGEVSFN